MKILFAIKTLNDAVGGAERVFCTIASQFAENKNTTTVLTFDNASGESFYKLSHKIKRIDLTIGDTSKRTNPLTFIKRMIVLRKTLIKQKPDIVIAFMHSMFVPMAFALIGTKIPIIASEHTVVQYYKKRPIQLILFYISCLFIKKITILSEIIKLQYPKILHKKMVVINNPIELPKEKANITRKKQKILLAVGRLDEGKDHNTLIHAFAQVTHEFPDWELRIAGDGVLKNKLSKTIKNLDLNHCIKMLGIVNTIDTEYKNAQLFVIPSKYEGFGLVVAEAMAYGLPAIGFKNCFGVNEIITDQHDGILTNGSDRVQSLANAMRQLMRDDKLRSEYGHNAYKSIKQRYKTSIVFEKWERLISTIIK